MKFAQRSHPHLNKLNRGKTEVKLMIGFSQWSLSDLLISDCRGISMKGAL